LECWLLKVRAGIGVKAASYVLLTKRRSSS
jgi:hypothetical protein